MALARINAVRRVDSFDPGGAAVTLQMNEQAVHVPLGTEDTLEAVWTVPDGATTAVLLADGTQSSVESRPFRFLSKGLNEKGLATLLLDLLTTDEAANVPIAAQMRLNVGLLAERFEAGTTWIKEHVKQDPLKVGYCVSAAASAAALLASLARSEEVRAVVSIDGRPDLVEPELKKVRAATLLIAADNLLPVLDANETANALLTCEKRLVLISGTTQLLEDQVVLENVRALMQDWFQRHLTPSPAGVLEEGAGARGSATQASSPRG
jgi:putative phosphoribosyl transferase